MSTTVAIEQLTRLPLVTRSALNALPILAGVDAVGGPRDATINGLPQTAINVTIDGVNVNNNLQSTDGFYSMIRPQMDAVEEVTVTGAAGGAEGAGQGAVNIRFVTRSGTNNLDTSLYYYLRHPSLNSNYWFNQRNGLPRNEVIVHQVGGRIGGPIVIPGLFDGHNKAFFFLNYEEFRQPTSATRTRTILTERGAAGRVPVQRHRWSAPADQSVRAGGKESAGRHRGSDSCGSAGQDSHHHVGLGCRHADDQSQHPAVRLPERG